MWNRMSLRFRVLLVVFCLVMITVGGGLLSMVFSYRATRQISSMVDVDMAALRAAQELENALVMQKGYVTYYFQDRNPEWLTQLENKHAEFQERIEQVNRLASGEAEQKIIDTIRSNYEEYDKNRKRVIAYYKSGNHDAGFRLHKALRNRFFELHDLCEQYRTNRIRRILSVRNELLSESDSIRIMALLAMPASVLLGLFLAYILLVQILKPIRFMATAAEPSSHSPNVIHELKELDTRVTSLIEDVDQTKTELERSQEQMLHSEKWAVLGKLAAGVAHSIRNPLTSVKMRLFSLERSLRLSETQREDFDVISTEIKNVDLIVQNFLEFSRPPKLKMQRVSPSEVVETALRLMKYRLESYNVDVRVNRIEPLPEIWADPDQLKEVLVNLIVNACEAMTEGGAIEITEETGRSDGPGESVFIRVSDNGHGVSEEDRDKLFQPFYSTKDEGTGLGLSIAVRIVEEHGGSLKLCSQEGRGSTFTITLPLGEEKKWDES